MVHPTTRATATAISAAISAATPLPAVLADIAAAYVSQPLPHELYAAHNPPSGKVCANLHCLSSFARIPAEDRPCMTLINKAGERLPVKLLGVSGFQACIRVLDGEHTGGEFVFDVSRANVSIMYMVMDNDDDEPVEPAISAFYKDRNLNTDANDSLRSQSTSTPEDNNRRIGALLHIGEDERPAIVLTARDGSKVIGQLRDANATHALVQVGADREVLHVFDVSKGELNFEVDTTNSASHKLYTDAMDPKAPRLEV